MWLLNSSGEARKSGRGSWAREVEIYDATDRAAREPIAGAPRI